MRGHARDHARAVGTVDAVNSHASARSRALSLAGVVAIATLVVGLTSAAPSGAESTRRPSARTATAERSGVEHLHFAYGPLDITPGQNLIQTNQTRIPQPDVDGWIVGFRPNLVLATGPRTGKVAPTDQLHLHHAVWATAARFDATAPPLPERFFAAGEEKTTLALPNGYGYPYSAAETWFLNSMVHNLTDRPFTVSITYDVDFVSLTRPRAATMHDVRPVWLDVQNGSIYPVFDVLRNAGDNGRYTYPDDDPNAYANGRIKNEWTVDRPGVLVAAVGHLHPGGLAVDLGVRRGTQSVRAFSATAKYFEPAGAVSWDVAMTVPRRNWRVQIEPGDMLSVSATYDTSRASWYESMGLMVLWIADGTGGPDPFTTKVDRPGRTTHGELPENRNHGGEPSHLEDARRAAGVPATAVDVADFFYEVGDLNDDGPIPTVAAGSSLTFTNLDAPGNVWHSITGCKAPCDGAPGIAYPLADATVPFDSGQLGAAGAPTAGRDSWNTPADLDPGTYTYFCRIHPFMRGAFRVIG